MLLQYLWTRGSVLCTYVLYCVLCSLYVLFAYVSYDVHKISYNITFKLKVQLRTKVNLQSFLNKSQSSYTKALITAKPLYIL
jgi:hypothetical protein